MRYFQGLGAAAALAALLTGGAAHAGDVVGLPSPAPDEALIGVGVICNTNDQAEQYISLRQTGQDLTPAVAKVNAQAQEPRACGVAAIAFVPDEILVTKTMGGRLVKIVRVNVVAGYNGSTWQRVAHTVQYAIVETKGEEI